MRHTSKFTRILSHVFTASMLLFVMASCKKDKSVDTGVTPPPAVTLSEYRNDDEFAKFEYNADGSVKKVTMKSELNTNGAIVDYNVTYNANKKIKELVTSTGSKIVPVYAGNVLERADIFDGGTDRSGYTNYLYEGGNLKRATIYLMGVDDFEPMLEFNFEYNAAGNVIKTVVMVSNGEPNKLVRAGHVEQQYDAKFNPLAAHKELLALLWHPTSKNNPTVEDHFDADLQPEDKTVYTYTYKANGYPENAQVKNGLPGGPQTTTNVQYIYK